MNEYDECITMDAADEELQERMNASLRYHCQCADPEPVLIEHGLGSLCEKCGERIL